jgi:Arc/MetJ family transcription regulator
MRTNFDLDDELISQAQRFTGLRSKREVVDAALREFVARLRQRQILELAGQGLIDPDDDVRESRARMSRASDAGPAGA